MKPGRAEQIEHILESLSVGVAILDATTFHVLYTNSSLLALLDEPWCYQDITGYRLEEIVPEKVCALVLPLLQQVAASGERLDYAEIPYEGFLVARGRTYWSISIERSPLPYGEALPDTVQDDVPQTHPLLVTIEDVTNKVRSRLHLNAINSISSAIAGASALPLVLDRILQALYEMVGSRRCAVLLIDQSHSDSRLSEEESSLTASDFPRTLTIAAQKGVHINSLDWHPTIDEHVLLGRVAEEGRTIIIADTSTVPDINFPALDEKGLAHRPGSALCVPIFDSHPATRELSLKQTERTKLLGAIEVYHVRARGFPAEEVELLEQFAQQAGLAIQNARLFRSIDRLARIASRQAHQRENVMQAIPDGVVIYDPRWRVASANHAARRLFGWNDEVLGLPIAHAMAQSRAQLPPDMLAQSTMIPLLEQRALAGQSEEIKIIGADGQHYTLNCSYTSIRDDMGDIFAFIIIYHNVTKEVAARESIEAEVVARTAELAQRNDALQNAKFALELESARMELLLDRLPSGVILVSAENHAITLMNCRAAQLLQHMGIPLEPREDCNQAAKNASGRPCRALFGPLQMYGSSGTLVPYQDRPLNRALTKGEASEAEFFTRTADGQTVYLLVNAAPLRSLDGTIMSVIVVIHDITRIKELERTREDFFTTMAHELKTPLANIRAHLSALLATDLRWSSEEQYDFLQTADEQVERLVGMINHFLDASRVEAGALRLELEPILLPEMLEDLQDRLEALISSSGRSLNIQLPDTLPGVMADYELIMSVLSNLLSNAFRYAPEGDEVVLEAEPISKRSTDAITGVKLSVIDRGPGLSNEQQRAIFTRFSTFAASRRSSADRPGQPEVERRRGSARWSPATGLGLYISRGIVEAHGSRLTLQSIPGQGARFSFILPAVGQKRKGGSKRNSNDKG